MSDPIIIDDNGQNGGFDPALSLHDFAPGSDIKLRKRMLGLTFGRTVLDAGGLTPLVLVYKGQTYPPADGDIVFTTKDLASLVVKAGPSSLSVSSFFGALIFLASGNMTFVPVDIQGLVQDLYYLPYKAIVSEVSIWENSSGIQPKTFYDRLSVAVLLVV